MDNDIEEEFVTFICEDCNEEYILPESTEICPICGSGNIHI